MMFFADTNWSAAAYFYKQANDRTAIVSRHSRKHQRVWLVSDIVMLEARNVFGRLSRQPNPKEWMQFKNDIGTKIVTAPPHWDLVKKRSNELFSKYSHKASIGTFDMTLIASALLSGADTFLSYDEQAKALAAAERLTVSPNLSEHGKKLLGAFRSG